MTLTKKHFKAIAEILAINKTSQKVIDDFCLYLKRENALFDEYKFNEFIQKKKAQIVSNAL